MSEQKKSAKFLNPISKDREEIPLLILKWLTASDRRYKMSPMTLLTLAATMDDASSVKWLLSFENNSRTVKANQDTLRRVAIAGNAELLIWLMSPQRGDRRVLPSKATLHFVKNLGHPPLTRLFALHASEDTNGFEVLEHKESLPTIQLTSSDSVAFTKAVKTGNLHTIAQALNQGYIPADLSMTIQIKHSAKKTLLEILLESHLKSSIESYRTAKKLLNLGAKLPLANKSRDKFSSLKEYFTYLVVSKKDLFIALATNPKIIREQDAEGNCLLHHAARMGKNSTDLYAALILDQLFSAPMLDLSLKNMQGKNPLHLAAAAHEPITQKTILPRFITAVLENYSTYSERMRYFSMLDAQGLSAIHYLVGNQQGQMNIDLLVEQFPTVDLDLPAASGITPFDYAIKNQCYHAVYRLLDYYVYIPTESLRMKLNELTEQMYVFLIQVLQTSDLDSLSAEMVFMISLKRKIQQNSTLNFHANLFRGAHKSDMKSIPPTSTTECEASDPPSRPCASSPGLYFTKQTIKQTFFHSLQPREPITRERNNPTDCFVHSRMEL